MFEALHRYLHSILRPENDCLCFLDGVEDDRKIILKEALKALQTLLQLDSDTLYGPGDQKYAVFLEHMNVPHTIPDGKTDADYRRALYKLYVVPKKRNNVFLPVLLAFFVQERSHRRHDLVFDLIHIYFLLITYRNRIPHAMREQFVGLNPAHFISAAEAWNTYVQTHISSSVRRAARLVGISVLGIVSLGAIGYTAFDHTIIGHLTADVSASVAPLDVSTLALKAFFSGFIGSGLVADGVLKDLNPQTLTLLGVGFLLVSSVRSVFNTFLSDTLISQIFAFIGHSFQRLWRIFTWPYAYLVNRFSNRMLFWGYSVWFRIRIRIGAGFLVLLGIIHFVLVASIVGVYVFGMAYAFGLTYSWLWQAGITVGISVLLWGANIMADVKNVQQFFYAARDLAAFSPESGDSPQ